MQGTSQILLSQLQSEQEPVDSKSSWQCSISAQLQDSTPSLDSEKNHSTIN